MYKFKKWHNGIVSLRSGNSIGVASLVARSGFVVWIFVHGSFFAALFIRKFFWFVFDFKTANLVTRSVGFEFYPRISISSTFGSWGLCLQPLHSNFSTIPSSFIAWWLLHFMLYMRTVCARVCCAGAHQNWMRLWWWTQCLCVCWDVFTNERTNELTEKKKTREIKTQHHMRNEKAVCKMATQHLTVRHATVEVRTKIERHKTTLIQKCGKQYAKFGDT